MLVANSNDVADEVDDTAITGSTFAPQNDHSTSAVLLKPPRTSNIVGQPTSSAEISTPMCPLELPLDSTTSHASDATDTSDGGDANVTHVPRGTLSDVLHGANDEKRALDKKPGTATPPSWSLVTYTRMMEPVDTICCGKLPRQCTCVVAPSQMRTVARLQSASDGSDGDVSVSSTRSVALSAFSCHSHQNGTRNPVSCHKLPEPVICLVMATQHAPTRHGLPATNQTSDVLDSGARQILKRTCTQHKTQSRSPQSRTMY